MSFKSLTQHFCSHSRVLVMLSWQQCCKIGYNFTQKRLLIFIIITRWLIIYENYYYYYFFRWLILCHKYWLSLTHIYYIILIFLPHSHPKTSPMQSILGTRNPLNVIWYCPFFRALLQKKCCIHDPYWISGIAHKQASPAYLQEVPFSTRSYLST